MAEYFKIGQFVATHGLGGELLLKHRLGKKTSLKGLKAIFIEEHKGSFIPWFITSARIKNVEEVYVTLDGIHVKETAMKLVRKEVWITETDFNKYSATSSPLNFLGYTIIEGEHALGTVIEVIEQPHQLICVVQYKNKETYIPLHAETIRKIDKKKQQVIVELPPGLLEIYQ